MKYTKGHNYIKTGRQITVPFLCILSNDALYFSFDRHIKNPSVGRRYGVDTASLYEINNVK